MGIAVLIRVGEKVGAMEGFLELGGVTIGVGAGDTNGDCVTSLGECVGHLVSLNTVG